MTVLLIASFMNLIDVTIVNVAIPSMQEDLQTTSSGIEWVIAVYILCFALGLLPFGRLGDTIGRRRMFLIGLAGFTVFSLACGFAPSASALAVLRLAQGVFAGIMNPQISALIQELFQGADRARAFGMFGMTVGVSTAIGPLLGGILVTGIGAEHGWRSVFLINVPIGLVLLPLAARNLPSTTRRSREDGVGLDVPGLLLIATIVLSVMWPFVTASSHPEGLAGAPWWLLLVAAALLIILVLWERAQDGQGRPAVLPRVLMRNLGFVMGATLAAAYFAGFTSIFVVVTMFYQDGLGTSALIAGLAQLPFALTSAIASQWSARRVMRLGRRIVVRGLLLMSAAVVMMAVVASFAPVSISQWAIPVLMGIGGWGSGSVISPNQTLTLAEVPVPLAGTAAGLMQTFQRLGGAMGLALLTTVYFARVAAENDGPEAYAHALGLSLVFTLAILLLATGIAVADARRRRSLSQGDGAIT